MEALLVSTCLLGCRCRYDGLEKGNPNVIAMTDRFQLIPVCPEQLGGLSTPRPPAERREDRVVTKTSDVTEQYRRGGGRSAEAGKALWLPQGSAEGTFPLLRQRANL